MSRRLLSSVAAVAASVALTLAVPSAAQAEVGVEQSKIGWDKVGWDKAGWDRNGWDKIGWDKVGWDGDQAKAGWD